MPEINVKIENKVAVADDSIYICGNSDYTVIFDFDDEWQDFVVKTARFSYNNSYVDIVFEGLTCSIPIIENTYSFDIGVYAGNLHTTTPARIPCKKSILCKNGSPVDPTPDVYAQLLDRINNIKATIRKDIFETLYAWITVDDGNGNITIKSKSGKITASGDGGNVRIASMSECIAVNDDGKNNVIVEFK